MKDFSSLVPNKDICSSSKVDKNGKYIAVGLMSGTSLDGIDAALLATDGRKYVKPMGFAGLPLDPDLRGAIKEFMGSRDKLSDQAKRMEMEITLAHADAVRELISITGHDLSEVDVIGFHGQTITHEPDDRFTWQMGNGDLLASELETDVVSDFRTNDVKAGGQGAPFIPVYHHAMALASNQKLPMAVLNIGGVSNITWIGSDEEKDMIAFDTGPGNALLNDFVAKRRNELFDRDGKLASAGIINQDLLIKWLSDDYFRKQPPKSLDRGHFDVSDLKNQTDENGAATLAAFTYFSVDKSLDFLPKPPSELLVTGGGRKNPVLMNGLKDILKIPVKPVEEIGWNGDYLEAEGMAYLAVRSLLGLPLSFPETTGVPSPATGGTLHKA